MVSSHGPMTKVPANYEVRYLNPGGYDKYTGTVTAVFNWGGAMWADIKWRTRGHPCTTPMELIHVKRVSFMSFVRKVRMHLYGKKTRRPLARKHLELLKEWWLEDVDSDPVVGALALTSSASYKAEH